MTAAKDLVIRDVRNADMDAIQAIYAHHVRHGLASWEESPRCHPGRRLPIPGRREVG